MPVCSAYDWIKGKMWEQKIPRNGKWKRKFCTNPESWSDCARLWWSGGWLNGSIDQIEFKKIFQQQTQNDSLEIIRNMDNTLLPSSRYLVIFHSFWFFGFALAHQIKTNCGCLLSSFHSGFYSKKQISLLKRTIEFDSFSVFVRNVTSPKDLSFALNHRERQHTAIHTPPLGSPSTRVTATATVCILVDR